MITYNSFSSTFFDYCKIFVIKLKFGFKTFLNILIFLIFNLKFNYWNLKNMVT